MTSELRLQSTGAIASIARHFFYMDSLPWPFRQRCVYLLGGCQHKALLATPWPLHACVAAGNSEKHVARTAAQHREPTEGCIPKQTPDDVA